MTRTPRGVTARRLVKALRQDGFGLQRTRGSHRVYRHEDGRRTILSYHSLSDTFPVGTLKAIINDIGWDDSDLVRLGLID